jgi:hypothetical protein
MPTPPRARFGHPQAILLLSDVAGCHSARDVSQPRVEGAAFAVSGDPRGAERSVGLARIFQDAADRLRERATPQGVYQMGEVQARSWMTGW